jgi:predicted lactoylglutathione lyase
MRDVVYINLPVADPAKSRDFFSRLGFRFDAAFSNEEAAAMVVSPSVTVMLLSERFFETFTPGGIADTRSGKEMLVALGAESREEVDHMLKDAIQAGGSEFRAAQDMGHMYGRSFEDLDGHLWEIVWVDQTS